MEIISTPEKENVSLRWEILRQAVLLIQILKNDASYACMKN